MKEETMNRILNIVVKEWIKQYGLLNIDPIKLARIKRILQISPHDDGFMPVKSLETGKTHKVPFEDIILKGLKGNELKKYEVIIE
jgi:hypothetical protein